MAYSKVSEMSQNLANSPGYNNFLMMPLIGMLLSRRKKETADESTTTEEKNYKNVPKNKDPNFTTMSAGVMKPLVVKDSTADVLGKIYNFMRMDQKQYMKNMRADKKYEKKLASLKEHRTKELIELFAGKKTEKQKKELVKQQKELEKPKAEEKAKPSEPPKTEPPKTEPPKTEPPKTTPKTEPPKTEAPKTTPKTEAPKTEAPKTETATKTTPKSEAPVTPPKAPELPPVSTATKVGVGVATAAVSAEVLAKIKGHEKYESKAYYDPKKDANGKVLEEFYSVGYGHQITKSEIKKGFIEIPGKKIPVIGELGKETTISKEDADSLAAYDYKKYEDAAKKITNFEKLNAGAQTAFIDMTYNMGVGWFTPEKWPNLHNALKNLDMESAAKSVSNSKYYKDTGNRAKQNVELIRNGIQGIEPKQLIVPKTVGEQLDNTSKENQNLKQSANTPAAGNVSILNNSVNQVHGSKVYQTPEENTSPPTLLQKQYK